MICTFSFTLPRVAFVQMLEPCFWDRWKLLKGTLDKPRSTSRAANQVEKSMGNGYGRCCSCVRESLWQPPCLIIQQAVGSVY